MLKFLFKKKIVKPKQIRYSPYDEVMSESWQKTWPNNCHVLEKTADGIRVGACWYYLKEGICPRHGKVK